MSGGGVERMAEHAAEVLPRDVPTATHAPDACAAHAAAQGSPRWAACEDHWLPAAVLKARTARLAEWRDLVPTPFEQSEADTPDAIWLVERQLRL